VSWIDWRHRGTAILAVRAGLVMRTAKMAEPRFQLEGGGWHASLSVGMLTLAREMPPSR